MLFLLSYLLLCTSLAFFYLCFQIGVLVVELTWFYAYCNGMVFMLYLRHNWCKFWICWCQFGWNRCVVFGDACLFICPYFLVSIFVTCASVIFRNGFPFWFIPWFHERVKEKSLQTFFLWGYKAHWPLQGGCHLSWMSKRTRVIAQITSFPLTML